MPSNQTVYGAIEKIRKQEKWSWSDRWWNYGEVVVKTHDKTYAIKDPRRATLPSGVIALGCTGQDERKKLHWVGWDFDVGHGKNSYEDLERAIVSARSLGVRVREFGGNLEIRTSKSGNGVHVRQLYSEHNESGEWGPIIAKAVCLRYDIKCCPASLGRQCHWLWCAQDNPGAYELIEEM